MIQMALERLFMIMAFSCYGGLMVSLVRGGRAWSCILCMA
jgi:hypothetical protein